MVSNFSNRGKVFMPKKNIPISKNRGYSNPSDHDGFAVVRVHNAHLAELGGRNAWVTLVSTQGKKAHRVVKGCGKARQIGRPLVSPRSSLAISNSNELDWFFYGNRWALFGNYQFSLAGE